MWKSAHVEPFLQGGKRCARLITTRMTDALPKAAKKVKVDAMRESEAVELLRTACRREPPISLPACRASRRMAPAAQARQ